jgi:hypothetical protein
MKVKMSWIGGTSVVEFKGGKATYYRKVASSNTSRLGAHEGFLIFYKVFFLSFAL